MRVYLWQITADHGDAMGAHRMIKRESLCLIQHIESL